MDKYICSPRCYVPNRNAKRGRTLPICWRSLCVRSNESEPGIGIRSEPIADLRSPSLRQPVRPTDIVELTGEFPWLDQTVQLTSTGTLPAPLQPDTYYTVKNPNSAPSRLQLANASGNIITITATRLRNASLHEAGVKTFEDQPNDIVFDRCVFQGGFTDTQCPAPRIACPESGRAE